MSRALSQLLQRIGRRLAELREGAGLTQQEFAEQLDLSVKYVQRVEGGHHNLSVGSLLAFARAVGVEVEQLFEPPRTMKRNRGRPPKKSEAAPAAPHGRKSKTRS